MKPQQELMAGPGALLCVLRYPQRAGGESCWAPSVGHLDGLVVAEENAVMGAAREQIKLRGEEVEMNC